MKIKSVAAAGALGLGIGFVGLIGGTATANAACGDVTTPPLQRARCLAQQDTDIFLNGTNTKTCVTDDITHVESCSTTNDGLGIKDQLSTFQDSINPANQLGTFQQSLKDFAAGPVAPANDPPAP